MISIDKWKWRGQPGHFCAANHCQFRLCTDVGYYRISSVGSMYVKELGPELQKVSYNHHYEIMVFELDGNGIIADLKEIECQGLLLSDNPLQEEEEDCESKVEAIHISLCHKYSNFGKNFNPIFQPIL